MKSFGWLETSLLILGGRITLLQSYLAINPLYYLSKFKMFVGVANRIGRMIRDFLWSGVGDDKKDYLVSWDLVCRPKDEGGFGLGRSLSKKLPLWESGCGGFLWNQILFDIE